MHCALLHVRFYSFRYKALVQCLLARAQATQTLQLTAHKKLRQGSLTSLRSLMTGEGEQIKR